MRGVVAHFGVSFRAQRGIPQVIRCEIPRCARNDTRFPQIEPLPCAEGVPASSDAFLGIEGNSRAVWLPFGMSRMAALFFARRFGTSRNARRRFGCVFATCGVTSAPAGFAFMMWDTARETKRRRCFSCNASHGSRPASPPWSRPAGLPAVTTLLPRPAAGPVMMAWPESPRPDRPGGMPGGRPGS